MSVVERDRWSTYAAWQQDGARRHSVVMNGATDAVTRYAACQRKERTHQSSVYLQRWTCKRTAVMLQQYLY